MTTLSPCSSGKGSLDGVGTPEGKACKVRPVGSGG